MAPLITRLNVGSLTDVRYWGRGGAATVDELRTHLEDDLRETGTLDVGLILAASFQRLMRDTPSLVPRRVRSSWRPRVLSVHARRCFRPLCDGPFDAAATFRR